MSAAKGRWQWDYVANSKNLGGSVKTTLVLDPTTGRLLSGSRTDKTGTTRFTFSYTTIFAPDRRALTRSRSTSAAVRRLAHDVPRLPDMSLLRPQVADGQPEHVPAAETRVGKQDAPGGVHGVLECAR